MKSDLEAVLQLLPKLPATQLTTIQRRTKALLDLNGAEKCTDDYLLEGIHHELRRRGVLELNRRLHLRQFPPNYVADSASVRAHLEKYLPTLPPVEKAALGQLSARTLSHYLEKSHTAVTPFNMLLRVSAIPLALDFAFPSYLSSGMLKFCWAACLKNAR